MTNVCFQPEADTPEVETLCPSPTTGSGNVVFNAGAQLPDFSPEMSTSTIDAESGNHHGRSERCCFYGQATKEIFAENIYEAFPSS